MYIQSTVFRNTVIYVNRHSCFVIWSKDEVGLSYHQNLDFEIALSVSETKELLSYFKHEFYLSVIALGYFKTMFLLTDVVVFILSLVSV